jgi:cellulose biosynthesis protein BcsQ
MRVLAVGAQKGGVGKTTTSLYLSARAARLLASTDERPLVALLDRDESKNLTMLLRMQPELLQPGIVLLDGEALPPVSAGFQLVIIDTPPGVSAMASLQQADLVLVPVQPEPQGIANLQLYLRNIDRYRRRVSPNLRLLALLPSMLKRTTLQRNGLAAIEEIAISYNPPLIVLPAVPERARIASYDLGAPEFDPVAEEVFTRGDIRAALSVGS